ncbi:MAG: LPS export ABC transporter permease LptG [Candidatus Eisenbacteria bacterium]|nr:LPS export ABC transporter permease LptG [Candidatus Latescibacterota bacterium]MBD3302367.1 LPS export ABC transporter permease LptG [Candidatus Eisenbacteria bacterium]
MRRLDRYVLRDFLLYCLMGILLFVGIYLIVDVFEKIDKFVDNEAAVATVVRYYLWSLPTILIQVCPLALLLASILSLGQLRRFNELTAMQGAGVSPVRIALPLLIGALLISAAAYGVGELLVPGSYRAQQRIMKVEIKGQEPEEFAGRLNIRYLGQGGNFYMVEYFDGATGSLRNVSVQELAGKEILRRIDAAAGRFERDVWLFENGHLRMFRDSVETAIRFERFATSRLREIPSDFTQPKEDPFRMSMADLARYAERVRESGGRDMKLRTDYHLRASFPLSNLIMVLLGASLSLRIVRGGNVAVGIGVTIFIGFAYYACLRAGQALGYSGTIPPILAAWIGNLLFGALGSVFFWKVTR